MAPHPTDLNHVHAFTAAMERRDLAATWQGLGRGLGRDLESMLDHMAEDVVLDTPLAADPVRGKPSVRAVVGPLLAVVDAFDVREVLQGPEHVASFFTAAVGQNQLDGMDVWRLDDDGMIRETTVPWRPLPTILAVQATLTGATLTGATLAGATPE